MSESNPPLPMPQPLAVQYADVLEIVNMPAYDEIIAAFSSVLPAYVLDESVFHHLRGVLVGMTAIRDRLKPKTTFIPAPDFPTTPSQ